MKPMTFGDTASFIATRRSGNALKQRIATLNTELTTGAVVDKGQHLRGDYRGLASITRTIENALVNKSNAQSIDLRLGSQQLVLSQLLKNAQASHDASLIGTSGAEPAPDYQRLTAISVADAAFRDAISGLNTAVAGRFLFSGVNSDTAPILPPDDVLDALIATLPVGSSPNDLQAHVVDWFALGGGFDLTAYNGGPAEDTRMDLGSGHSVAVTTTAQAAEIRQTLAALALGAVLAKGVFANDPAAQHQTINASSDMLRPAKDGLVTLSASIGIQESRAAQAGASAAAEITAMEIARSDLIGVDSFDTATRLQDAMTKLDMIYMMTARLSRLSLTEYLR